MRRILLMVAGLTLVAAYAPMTASADHCLSNVVIFSGVAGAPKVNSNAGACAADPVHDTPYDGRIINPGSNEISVRYIVPCAVGDQINGEISGDLYPGGQTILLTCTSTTTGIAYNSPAIALVPTRTGCVTATIEDVDAEDGSNTTTFHTVGATC